MRITNNTITNNVLQNLNSNSEKLNELSEQVSSGKKFQTPSEDPSSFVDSMQLESLITDNEQYQTNIESGSSWLTSAEDALSSAGDVLDSIRELTVEAASETLTQDDRETILTEVEELEKELKNIANTQQGDKYLFSGTATSTEAFNEDGEYQGDYNSLTREISSNTEIEISVNGEEAFGDAFDAVESLKSCLENGDTEELSNSVLEDIDEAINTNDTFVTEVGAKQNRLDFTQTRLEDENTNLNEILSSNEDVDEAEAITEYSTQQTVYEAALSVSSSILQTSLVNYVS